MRAAYFDCPSGASGNMLLGAFLDAGAPADALQAAISALGLDQHAGMRREQRAGDGGGEATYVEIDVRQAAPWRSVGEIDAVIAGARLDEGVRERSRLAFRLLAKAESEAHGIPAESVRLHETGAVDAVVDVVGTFALAEALGVEAFFCSPLPLSGGTVTAAHGEIPLPAPATVRILDAVRAPTYRRECGAELVTPTGAAIIGACATFVTPRLETDHEGSGAGSTALPWPNVLRVQVGELQEPPVETGATGPAGAHPGAAPLVVPLGTTGGPLSEETVAVLETAVDDMPANLIATLPGDLISAGALDAWLSPILMKKGRPGHQLTVICPVTAAPELAELIVRHTSTLGVRVREERRLVAGRRIARVPTSLGEIAVKIKTVGGVDLDATPEWEDVRAAAERTGLPLAEAHRRATAEVRRAILGQD